MPMVSDILRLKATSLVTVSPDVTVHDAVQTMNRNGVGAVIVVGDDGDLAGIFTERDVLRRVVAEARDPARTRVQDVCTTEVICCPAETDIDDASRIMTDKRIRHLPVVSDDGQLLGLVSIGDLNAWHASSQEQTIHFLSDYIYGRV
jgi:CBS domain-containing protein